MSFSLFDLKFDQYYGISAHFVSVFDVNNTKNNENYQKKWLFGSAEMSFVVSEMSFTVSEMSLAILAEMSFGQNAQKKPVSNSSQETAPIGTNDIPLNLYGHVDQAQGMHFPELFATLE